MRSFLVRIFLYLDWIWRFTEYIFVFSPNTGKYGPEGSLYNTRWEMKISLTLNFLHDFSIFIVPSAILLVFQISVKTCHFTHHELWLRLSVSSSCWVNLHVVWDTYTPWNRLNHTLHLRIYVFTDFFGSVHLTCPWLNPAAFLWLPKFYWSISGYWLIKGDGLLFEIWWPYFCYRKKSFKKSCSRCWYLL